MRPLPEHGPLASALGHVDRQEVSRHPYPVEADAGHTVDVRVEAGVLEEPVEGSVGAAGGADGHGSSTIPAVPGSSKRKRSRPKDESEWSHEIRELTGTPLQHVWSGVRGGEVVLVPCLHGVEVVATAERFVEVEVGHAQRSGHRLARIEGPAGAVGGQGQQRERGDPLRAEKAQTAPHWPEDVDRARFRREVACDLRRTVLDSQNSRARRLARREAELHVLENYELLVTTRVGVRSACAIDDKTS